MDVSVESKKDECFYITDVRLRDASAQKEMQIKAMCICDQKAAIALTVAKHLEEKQT